MEHRGIRRGRSLISPLSWKRERAAAFLEQREDFAASRPAHLQDEESFSLQRVKRVRNRRPSQRGGGAKCSLLGVCPRS